MGWSVPQNRSDLFQLKSLDFPINFDAKVRENVESAEMVFPAVTPPQTVWVNSTTALSASRQGPYRPVFKKKIARLVGRLGSGPRLVRRVGSEVRVSASFHKNALLLGRLGSGSRLVADRANVVFTHTCRRRSNCPIREGRWGGGSLAVLYALQIFLFLAVLNNY